MTPGRHLLHLILVGLHDVFGVIAIVLAIALAAFGGNLLAGPVWKPGMWMILGAIALAVVAIIVVSLP